MFSLLTNNEKKQIYSIISSELISENIDGAIWTQAFSESGGDVNKARSIYIKHRFSEIKDEVVARKKEAVLRHGKNQKHKIDEAERKNNEAERAANRMAEIKRIIPFAERRAEAAESRFLAGEKILEKLFMRECELAEEVENSCGYTKKVKQILLERKRRIIKRAKGDIEVLIKEKDKRNKILDNYRKELRDLEHQFGR